MATASLNSHNLTYYQHFGTTGVPDLLATASPIQEAIRLEIEQRITHDPIRILELGFGSRPDRYIHIASCTTRQWQVTLSDFDIQILPDKATLPQSSACQFSYNKFDLLQDTWEPAMYDVILSTYTFDSITFPEDRYEHNAHYPGGLIQVVIQSRDHLAPGGLFLTIDKWAHTHTPKYEVAGGARFKSLDLTAAAKVLSQTQEFAEVTLTNLNDFLEDHHVSLPIDLSDHGCLIISR